jgi:hypothetical protein
MAKHFILILFFGCGIFTANAQLMQSFVHQGEFGIGAGAAHYFGDLNPTAAVNRPKANAGIFFRKQFNNYMSVRLSGEYALLGYSDQYSNNATQLRRNLSFNSHVWEAAVSFDFNFFTFQPGFEDFRFTPYIGVGVGAFSYDPYAFLGNQKYFLRPLGTEGQGSSAYPAFKTYAPIAVSVPLTLGVKYALSEQFNVFAELMYRFTNTDYLDDVSGVYAPDAFPTLPDGSPSPAFLLQDRSYETANPIGIKGRQRGNTLQTDVFAGLKLGFSFNLQTYKCPKPVQ